MDTHWWARIEWNKLDGHALKETSWMDTHWIWNKLDDNTFGRYTSWLNGMAMLDNTVGIHWQVHNHTRVKKPGNQRLKQVGWQHVRMKQVEWPKFDGHALMDTHWMEQVGWPSASSFSICGICDVLLRSTPQLVCFSPCATWLWLHAICVLLQAHVGICGMCVWGTLLK